MLKLRAWEARLQSGDKLFIAWMLLDDDRNDPFVREREEESGDRGSTHARADQLAGPFPAGPLPRLIDGERIFSRH